MPDQWFRVPRVGTGTADDPYRPQLFGENVEGWAGTVDTSTTPPTYLVRVDGTSTALEAIAQASQSAAFGSVPVTALNNAVGDDRDAAGWRDSFRVGGEA